MLSGLTAIAKYMCGRIPSMVFTWELEASIMQAHILKVFLMVEAEVAVSEVLVEEVEEAFLVAVLREVGDEIMKQAMVLLLCFCGVYPEYNEGSLPCTVGNAIGQSGVSTL